MTGPDTTDASGRRADPPPGASARSESVPSESPPAGSEPATAEQTSDAGEFLTAAGIIGIGVVFWIGAADYSDAARRWPVFLSSVVVGLGLVNLLALVYRRTVAGRGATVDDTAGAAEAITAAAEAADRTALTPDADAHRGTALKGYGRQVATGLFCIAYAVLGYGAGFLVATAVLVPLYILLSFRPRRPLLAVLVTVVLLVFMHVVFTGALNAPLHRGVWVGVDLGWLPF